VLAKLTMGLAITGAVATLVLLFWMRADPIEFDGVDSIGAVVTALVTYPPAAVGLVLGGTYYVVSSLWLHRSRQFAVAVNPSYPHRLGAAWIWLAWFVPIVNFWFPYWVVRDIEEATGPATLGNPVAWWWGLEIGAWILGRPDGIMFSLVSWAMALVAFGYWLTVISTVSRAQWNHVRAAERAAQRSW
jgi:hypothetical protein